MGYDLKSETTVFGNNDNTDWLGSSHGVNAADSITLDAAALLTAFPSGEVPSGLEVSRNTSTGRYVPGWAGSGRDAAGFLLQGLKVVAGGNPIGALLWHGEVITAKVPYGVGGAAPTPSAHPQIRFV